LGWQSHLDELLAQPDLLDDHLKPFIAAIRAADSPFDKHVFLWCVENYVAMRQLAPGDAHLVFYENLCEHPKSEVEGLFAFLGQPVTPGVYSRLSQPSELTREESAIVAGGSLIDSWREQVTPSMISSAMRILALFGLDAIYTAETSMPNVEAAISMLGARSRPPVAATL
jgi:hypothetical protein